ncbi:MAG: Diphthamide synthase DPH6 [Candidatus Methanohalarchaeum thermophilum]|uniref:Diphthamide synthase DPH6 n=1 Tax=Methanohalarchaeum thermophilum TaxID=1903181 RepID=A0A1Q6DXN7_METT1|nr:MAG: Diphthamide synthase DPH6 [Candidatus Methanohalarchaeum thermophilum]
MKAFVSWSGGKETVLALYKLRDKIKPLYLLNMVSEDGDRSRSHGLNIDLIKEQSKAIGIPIIQRKAAWENYEEKFKEAISDMKKEDIGIGVFGDIDIQEHREWVERVCKEMNIEPVMPLWNKEREEILREFIDAGFKAIIVSTEPSYKELLGQEIDESLLSRLKDYKDFDLCGEKGEYHTYVYDGPIFQDAVKIGTGEKITKRGKGFLELRLKNK